MTRKPSMPCRRLPVDFRHEPAVPLTIYDLRLTRSSRASRENSSSLCSAVEANGKDSCGRESASTLQRFNASTHSATRITPRKSEIVNRKSQGFTLIEILVVLVLLSLIVFALMAVFSGTQRAFRSAITYADSQEGGRAVMDLIASDIEGATPSYYNSNFFGFTPSNQPVNFYISELNFAQPYPPTPLIQSIITSSSGAQVTNLLEKIFVLGKNNINGVPSWIGTGYSVGPDLPDGTLYPLYRFYLTTNASSGTAGVAQMFNSFVNFQYTNSTQWSHLMDGVVRLTALPYDTNGVLMTNGYVNPAAFHVRFVNFDPDPYYGLVDTVFYSNAEPASVQIELGTLEDRALQHAEALTAAAQSNYLSGDAAQVHVFRQRVWIRNLDPTAYQQ